MITGFLFISKLINARSSPIDWGRLFISRFLRIAPLYFFCIVLLLIIVAILSKGRVNEPILTLIQEVMHWIGFTTLRQADINGLKNTFTITAGATWSIPYEWIFYLLLPGIACFYRLRPSPRVLLMSVAGVLIAIAAHAALKFLGIFLGGLIAALLVKSDKFCQFATKKIASYICILCIITTISCFNSAYHLIPFGLLTVTFSLIAGGNSLFGAMLNKTSRTLGEFAYSIYLIHGIVLFITFNFIIGLPVAATLSPTAHWAIIWAITPVLIGISAITFRFIEYPSIQSTTAIINYLRK